MQWRTRPLALLSLVLCGWAPWAWAGSVLVRWDYPATASVSQFRIYRVTGACPPSALLPQAQLSVAAVDSQETRGENGVASNAIDGNPATYWHSEWSQRQPPLPHRLVLDLGRAYQIDGLRYLPRQDGGWNGIIVQYTIAVSVDGRFWSDPVAAGAWPADTTEKTVTFPVTGGRFLRLTALTAMDGTPWTSAAEVRISAAPTVVPPATPVGTAAGTVRMFTDRTVAAGRVHCWYVTAVGTDGTESPESNAIELGAPGIGAPTNVRAAPQ